MLIYVNITDRQTDGQTHQKYSSEPHKTFSFHLIKLVKNLSSLSDAFYSYTRFRQKSFIKIHVH